MSGKKKIWLALALSALSSPLMCGGMIGLAMGEKIMPDGRIGQDPWQLPFALFIGAVAFVYLVVFSSLLVVLIKKAPPNISMILVRITGLSPLGGGVAMFVAAYQRVAEGLYVEATGASLVGLVLCLLGYRLVSTKVQEFQES